MNYNFLIWVPGPTEIIIILIIVILLFGAKKIPELMKGVGKGIKEFKNATSKDDDDKESGTTEKLEDKTP